MNPNTYDSQLCNAYEISPQWEKYRRIQSDIDSLILYAPEITEGVLSCPKCGSQKTYCSQKQIRRADEGYTLFAKCSTCRYQWREN